MDKETIISLIYDLSRGGEGISQVEAIFNDLKIQNYTGVLNELTEIALTSNNSHLVFNSIILIYQEAKRNQYFFEHDGFSIFWEGYISLLHHIVYLDSSQENTKRVSFDVVTHAILYFASRNPSDCSFSDFLVSLINEDSLYIPYATFCLKEVMLLYRSSNGLPYAGFSLNTIIELLNYKTEPLIRIGLYFGALSQNTKCEELKDYLFPLLNEITVNDLAECFYIISRFSEENASFFAFCLSDFINYVCNNIINGSDKIKMHGIYLLQSIANQEPEMCKTSKEYILPVISTLITVMGEITQNSSWEPDLNDTEPSTIAREAFEDISKAVNGDLFLEFFLGIIEDEFSNPDASWQSIYSIFVAISNISAVALSNVLNDKEEEDNMPRKTPKPTPAEKIEPLVQPIITVLNEDNINPRVRYEAFNAIINICAHFYPMFQDANANVFPKLRESVRVFDDINLAKVSIRALTAFIKPLRDCTIRKFYPELLYELIEDIQNYSCEETVPLFIECLGVFLSIIGTDSRDKILEISEFFVQFLECDPPIKISSIEAFANSIKKYSPNQISEELHPYIAHFFENAASSKYEAGRLGFCSSFDATIRTLISKLGSQYQQYSDEILSVVFQKLDSLPEVTLIRSYEPIENLSACITLTGPSQEFRAVLEKSVVDDYIGDIKLLSCSIIALELIYLPLYYNTIDIIKKILAYEYSIEEIKETVWQLIYDMMDMVQKSQDHTILSHYLNYIVDSFVNETDNASSPSYIKSMILTVDKSLKILVDGIWTDETQIKRILGTFTGLISYMSRLKEEKIHNQKEWNALDVADPYISKIDDALSNLLYLFKRCSKLYPEVTYSYFLTEFKPVVLKYLECEHFRKFALDFLFIYTYRSLDSSVFIETQKMITSLDFSSNPDVLQSLFDGIGRYIEHIELTPDEIQAYYKYLFSILNWDCIINNEYLLAEDAAIVALSVLISKYRDYFDPYESIDSWMGILPVHEQNKRNDIVYNLLADLIAEKHEALFASGDHVKILFEQIGNVFNYLISENVRRKIATALFPFYTDPANRPLLAEQIFESNFGPEQWKGIIAIHNMMRQLNQIQR